MQDSQQQSSRIILVSHRLPTIDGHVGMLESNPELCQMIAQFNSGGLQNLCLLDAGEVLKEQKREVIWVGYFGVHQMQTDEETELKQQMMSKHQVAPVFMDTETAKTHFIEFSKGVIWPLFHYFGNGANDFSPDKFKGYHQANMSYAETIESIYQEGDLILIQDYHLMLLPMLLREKIPTAKISFFLHIPWPTSELYRSLPVRTEILQGLLGADLIGFNAFSYSRHFLSACTKLLGLTITDKGVWNTYDKFVRVEVIPVGIDSKKQKNFLNTLEAQTRMAELKQAFAGKKILVSRDRMEYIKGIPRRLKAFETFLTMYPEWIGRVVMFQECRPSLEVLNERAYMALCEEIEQMVGSINGKFGTIGYAPIHYFNKYLKDSEAAALFAVADVGLVTPLRDGMNLTSFEYIVCQRDNMNPLILSEFSGSAQCLSGAILVNPWDEKKFAQCIDSALKISEESKRIRFKHNYDYVVTHDAKYWIDTLVHETETSHMHSPTSGELAVLPLNKSEFLSSYRTSDNRVFLLDYDGTLSPLVKRPELAVPSASLVHLLKQLSSNPKNTVYVISGRGRESLVKWLGDLPVGISCEHGAFFRPAPKQEDKSVIPEWQNIAQELDMSWKTTIYSIFEDFTDRTPGSFIEQKEINLTWHYRGADPEFGEYNKNELMLHLQNLPGLPIDIVIGKKCVEVRPQGIHKGMIIRRILTRENPNASFVVCIGDDKTDEDMFGEMRKQESHYEKGFSITVQKKPSLAEYYVDSQSHVVQLLNSLVEMDAQ